MTSLFPGPQEEFLCDGYACQSCDGAHPFHGPWVRSLIRNRQCPSSVRWSQYARTCFSAVSSVKMATRCHLRTIKIPARRAPWLLRHIKPNPMSKPRTSWWPYKDLSYQEIEGKIWNASRICVSSLRRGHANLLCIVPILVYVPPKRVQYIVRTCPAYIVVFRRESR